MPNRFQYTGYCRGCGRERRDDERFSARGKCPECSISRPTRNIIELNQHSGEAFDNWRRRVAASVGAVLLDDL